MAALSMPSISPGGAKTNYISTATTTTVKSGGGVFYGLTLGETAAGAITLTIDGATAGVLKASIVEGDYFVTNGIRFMDSLAITTAGASKLTVFFD